MNKESKIVVALAAFVVAVFSFAAVTNAAAAKVSICHVTGSKTNGIVVIDTSVESLDAHLAHGDFLPLPDKGCEDGGPLPE